MEYPRRDKLTGVLPGCEHAGKPLLPMREKLELQLAVLLGCPVDPRLGQRTRIGVYHAQPIKPRPNLPTQGECSMEDRSEARGIRYIALDIHKKYCVIAGVDREGRVGLQPVRVEHADLEGWLKLSPPRMPGMCMTCWHRWWNGWWWPTPSK